MSGRSSPGFSRTPAWPGQPRRWQIRTADLRAQGLAERWGSSPFLHRCHKTPVPHGRSHLDRTLHRSRFSHHVKAQDRCPHCEQWHRPCVARYQKACLWRAMHWLCGRWPPRRDHSTGSEAEGLRRAGTCLSLRRRRGANFRSLSPLCRQACRWRYSLRCPCKAGDFSARLFDRDAMISQPGFDSGARALPICVEQLVRGGEEVRLECRVLGIP